MLHLLGSQKKRKNRYLSNWMPSVRLTMTFVKVQQTSFSNSRASWPSRQNKRYFDFFSPGVGQVPWEQYDCSFADWESWSLAFHDQCDLIFNLTIAAICLVFLYWGSTMCWSVRITRRCTWLILLTCFTTVSSCILWQATVKENLNFVSYLIRRQHGCSVALSLKASREFWMLGSEGHGPLPPILFSLSTK